ncbi:MAG TPA: hypothetical protein VF395_22515, partial [Polyangiaceae bacterium]
EVRPEDLPPSVSMEPGAPLHFGGKVLPLREMQRRYVVWAHDLLGSRRMLTAEKLGIDDKTLARWLARDVEGSTE